jgi:hypothetical protein
VVTNDNNNNNPPSYGFSAHRVPDYSYNTGMIQSNDALGIITTTNPNYYYYNNYNYNYNYNNNSNLGGPTYNNPQSGRQPRPGSHDS